MDSETICSFIRRMALRNSPTSYGDDFPRVFYYFTGLKVESASLRHEFYSKTMTILFTSLSIEMRGYLEATPLTSNESFALSLNFKNISIDVIAGSQYDLWYKDGLYLYIDFESYESNYIYSPRFYVNSTPEVQHQMETLIEFLSLPLFQFNLRKNEDFKQILDATFCQHPEDEITSYYPSLDIVETKCYFFISNFTSLHRTLSNITIIGMHNFHSHSFVDVSTLIIEDIQGTTNLHYEGRNFTIFPLHFEIGFISISVDRKQQRINVTAHNYTIIETKMNVSLTEYQSKWVMEGIQLAIASSIMPSMKYQRNRKESTNSLEKHPIVKISTKLSQQFESRTIQKLYDAITIPESFKAETTIQIGSSIYNISIDPKPETALKPYPAWIICSLYNELQIQFKTSYWMGKISVLNTTHKFNEIEFEMGDVFVGVNKQNNSNDFVLESAPTFDVQLLSNPYNFTDQERLQIAQKTQQTIVSLIEKTVSRFAEPLLSLPLDYCTAPVKIFDDLLPFYADHELLFHVPDGRITNESFISNVNNVIITEWAKRPSAVVTFDQHLVNGSVIISTNVDLNLAVAKIRMNFNNNRMIPFHELHLRLGSLQVRNYTDIAEIAVLLNSFPWEKFYSEDNKEVSLSTEKIDWIKMKLQYILNECFNNLTSLIF
ncbi:uncharacterized protein LOC135837328 isoform X2 [Planococcus citri]